MPNDCYQSRVKVTAPSGLLAGITTEKTGCGSTEMPWVIQAASGQTIRFTLFNYALSLTWNGTVSVPQAEQHCHVYAIVKENTPGRGKTICAGKSRQEFVYETSTNEVEVRMTMGSGTKLKRYFLLKYEGTCNVSTANKASDCTNIRRLINNTNSYTVSLKKKRYVI